LFAGAIEDECKDEFRIYLIKGGRDECWENPDKGSKSHREKIAILSVSSRLPTWLVFL
jgi:hypothetical protein